MLVTSVFEASTDICSLFVVNWSFSERGVYLQHSPLGSHFLLFPPTMTAQCGSDASDDAAHTEYDNQENDIECPGVV